MIHSSSLRVKAAVREQRGASRQIPFAFRADPTGLDGLGLDPTARAVFVLVLDNARSRGWRSRLSNATVGRILGRCPMTISRALGRLESAGLIRRELAAGGRIRTGILVTWDGVEPARLTEQACVRRERLTGSALAQEGLGASAAQIRGDSQSGDQTGSVLPLGEEPGEVPDGPTAAAFLRAMIAKGRAGGCTVPPSSARGGYTVPPPHSVSTSPAPGTIFRGTAEGTHQACPPADFARVRKTEPPAEAPRVATICKSGPRPSQDDVRREVERMAAGVFIDARRAAWGPSPGRRRMTPAEIQRQLAIVRAKYAGRGSDAQECAAARGPAPRE